MLHRLLLLVLLFMFIGSIQAENYSPIETLMTDTELKQSGIAQLTKKELEVLNLWLQIQSSKGLERESVQQDLGQDVGQDNVAQNSEVQDKSVESAGKGKSLQAKLQREARPEITKIIYLDRKSEDVISARIAGAFAGWRGKTLFELDNGQIWRQRYSGYWKVKLDSPEVSIKKNGSGAYEMKLVSAGKKIGVKRVR